MEEDPISKFLNTSSKNLVAANIFSDLDRSSGESYKLNILNDTITELEKYCSAQKPGNSFENNSLTQIIFNFFCSNN